MSKYQNFTESQLKEKNIILMYFKKWTRDRSGSISAREMKSVFRALGIQASDHEIISVVDKMDVDGDGEVSFDEFVRVMGTKFFRKYEMSEIKKAFKHFDVNNDGYITTRELKEALSRVGRNYDEREINRMIKSVDKNGDGLISIDEFAELLNQ